MNFSLGMTLLIVLNVGVLFIPSLTSAQAPIDDNDADGWVNPGETWYFGTDSNDACSIPPDVSRDGRVNLTDVVLFGPTFNKPAPNDATEYRRFDLNYSGSVNLSDVVRIGPWFNKPNC